MAYDNNDILVELCGFGDLEKIRDELPDLKFNKKNANIFKKAIKHAENIHIVQILIEHIFLWRNQYKRLLIYKTIKPAFLQAIKNNHIQITVYLAYVLDDLGFSECLTIMMPCIAAEYGHIDIFKWYFENCSIGLDSRERLHIETATLKAANKHSQYNIIEYITTNSKIWKHFKDKFSLPIMLLISEY